MEELRVVPQTGREMWMVLHLGLPIVRYVFPHYLHDIAQQPLMK